MTKEEKIAIDRYNSGEKHSIACFIDEDTIIAGYGGIEHYDFVYPLPTDYIVKIYGTTSWNEYKYTWKLLYPSGEKTMYDHLLDNRISTVIRSGKKCLLYRGNIINLPPFDLCEQVVKEKFNIELK